jgi:transcription initiation factor TFIIB
MQKSLVCFACGNEGSILDKGSGEVVCNYCGVVIRERIEDLAHDLRVVSGDDARRTGSYYSLSHKNKGFSTVIGRRNYGGLTPDHCAELYRIRVWDSRIRSSYEKKLEKGLFELARLRESIGLPDTAAERSAYFFRKSSELGLTRGRTVTSLIAASVYLACREAEIPKTLGEISKVSNIDRKRLSRDYRLLSRTFCSSLPVTDPMRSVTKIANIVGVSELKKRRAIGFVNALMDIGVSAGKSPLGLAAATIYLVCKNTDEEKTQVALAQAAGITEVTIRNRCAELARLVASKKIPPINSSLAAIALVSIQLAMVTNLARLPTLVH